MTKWHVRIHPGAEKNFLHLSQGKESRCLITQLHVSQAKSFLSTVSARFEADVEVPSAVRNQILCKIGHIPLEKNAKSAKTGKSLRYSQDLLAPDERISSLQ
jgi:hypothetical protein